MEGGPKHEMEYDPPEDNIESFTMFLQDVKQLGAEDRATLVSAVQHDKVGLVTMKIKDEAERKISLGPDMSRDDKINALLDALDEIAPMVMPDDVMDALKQEKDHLEVTFVPYQ